MRAAAPQKPKERAQRLDKERRREQILECARDAFAEQGYANATIDDIVGRAGVARGTFYLYFGDKRAVFEALVDRFFEKIAGSIRGIDVNHPTEPPKAQLRGNVFRITTLALNEPAMMKVLLYDATGLDPEFDAKLRSFYAAVKNIVSESLAEGQQNGLVRAGDRQLMVAFALGGLKEILLDSVTGQLCLSADAITDALVEFLERGFLSLA